MKSKFKKIIRNENFLIWMIVALFIILIFSLFFSTSFKNNNLISAEIIIINGCDECFDINSIADGLSNQPELNIEKVLTLDYQSEKGKSIIKKYNLSKIPSLILESKKIEKINVGLTEDIVFTGKNYLIFNKVAPYLDLNSKNTKGIVDFIEIQDKSCVKCGSYFSFVKNMENSGLKKGNYEIVYSDSEKGKSLIEKNKITFFPSLLINKEFSEYWWIIESSKNKFVEYENYYLVSTPVYPYKEIFNNNEKGIVDIKYLTNKSCEDCINIKLLKEAFQQIGIYIYNEKEIDVSSLEGKKIITDYNINTIPTLILSKEISDYTELKELLNQVGTIENDGTFVFRKIKELNGKYQEI